MSRDTATRRRCFDANKRVDEIGCIYLECHICKGRIYPGQGQVWECEHVIPYANGGTETLPAHKGCHAEKTKRDVSEIAKGKRVFDRHFGIKRSGGRHSRWKRKMSGEVVER